MIRPAARRTFALTILVLSLAGARLPAQPPKVSGRAAEYDVIIEKNVAITVRDGTNLAAERPELTLLGL